MRGRAEGDDIITAEATGTARSSLMGHFGLGLLYYTHYTSPIRRYADVMVHRREMNGCRKPPPYDYLHPLLDII